MGGCCTGNGRAARANDLDHQHQTVVGAGQIAETEDEVSRIYDDLSRTDSQVTGQAAAMAGDAGDFADHKRAEQTR